MTTPPEWCDARIWPSWSNQWVTCGSAISPTTGRCGQYGHPRKPQETTMPNPTGPNDPGAQDECAVCSHARWRHHPVDGQQVCTEYLDCACGGEFVELSYGTRMSRFVEAAQNLAVAIQTARDGLQAAMRATTTLYHAMQAAELIPAEQPTPTPRPGPTLRQPGDWHTVTCDKRCGGTCMELTHPQPTPEQLDNTRTRLAEALDIPEALLTGPSADNIPDNWTQAAPLHDTGAYHAHQSCPTCWPRPCDPTRSMCRRNPETTQTLPAITSHTHPSRCTTPDCTGDEGCPHPQPTTGEPTMGNNTSRRDRDMEDAIEDGTNTGNTDNAGQDTQPKK